MVNRPFPTPRRGSRRLLHDLSRPLSPDSVHFQLFRLEALFQALQELWGMPAPRIVRQGRRLRAVTGAECTSRDGSGSLRPALALGSRICDRALRGLEREEADPNRSGAVARMRELRGLLVTLDDLADTAPANIRHRPGYDQAARELARLLGHPDDAGVDLIQACIATARSLAAEALAGLYLRPCR